MRRFPLVLLLAFTSLPADAAAQNLTTRPHADWSTVETEHFVIHYPDEMAEWTAQLASRIESVREAVTVLVGSEPGRRVTVVVEDPFNVSNGYALPFLDAPTMVLWPTPPEPSSLLGNYSRWGELLALHEYAHIAHLARPSRNRVQRAIWKVLPARLSPLAIKAPRWLIEGYATYVEGKLTRSGRPYGAARPAILRQWALEGKLPRYAELNSTDAFFGGSMAYLAGSAFLQWLTEREGGGEESLVHLWRRMSARRERSFTESFAGVFGGTPADLYGRFTAELTGKALQAEARLQEKGIVRGETVQQLTWYTGAPALSRDGSLIAIQLRYEERPSRIVVWKTSDEPERERAARQRERLRRLDPQDVPAVSYRPEPKEAVATLHAVAGRAHESPRFFADGKRLLVSRYEPLGDGRQRPDLFIWNHKTDDLTRVTRGAGIRYADPSPDGRQAVGVRCLNGACDLVRVEIATGSVSVLAAGSPRAAFYRPRYSRDGRHIVVAVQQGAGWRLALASARGGPLRLVGPDDGASRYDATFLPDGDRLVAVSEAGGIANLELLSLRDSTTRPLTRVTSAALAPEPNAADGSVYFLALHGRGFDLNRIALDSAPDTVIALDPSLVPVAPPYPAAQTGVTTFTEGSVSRPRPYIASPRQYRLLPGGSLTAEGANGTLLFGSTDPIGRLSWAMQGSYGGAGTWRGATLGAVWRGFRPGRGRRARSRR